jgi:hypothetical protein
VIAWRGVWSTKLGLRFEICVGRVRSARSVYRLRPIAAARFRPRRAKVVKAAKAARLDVRAK